MRYLMYCNNGDLNIIRAGMERGFKNQNSYGVNWNLWQSTAIKSARTHLETIIEEEHKKGGS